MPFNHGQPLGQYQSGGDQYSSTPTPKWQLSDSWFGGGSGATASYANVGFTDPAKFTDHNGLRQLGLLDQCKNTLSGRYEYDTGSSYWRISGPDSNSAVGVFLPGNGVQITHRNQQAILKLTTILSQSLVNQANVGYQRFRDTRVQITPFPNSQVGISNLPGSTDQSTRLYHHPGF